MDISIDIETLSSRPNAMITQIGAVAFDRYSDTIDEQTTFLVNCAHDSAWPRLDLYHIDPKTVVWWMDQTDDARKSLMTDLVVIREALDKLRMWIISPPISFKFAHHEIEDRIWANSPSFDLTILRYAMTVEGIWVPWHFRQEHDMRTIVTLAQERKKDVLRVIDTGTAHRADHDAIRQAKIIQLATKWLME